MIQIQLSFLLQIAYNMQLAFPKCAVFRSIACFWKCKRTHETLLQQCMIATNSLIQTGFISWNCAGVTSNIKDWFDDYFDLESFLNVNLISYGIVIISISLGRSVVMHPSEQDQVQFNLEGSIYLFDVLNRRCSSKKMLYCIRRKMKM